MEPEAPGLQTGLVVALEANFCRVWLAQPTPAGVEQLLCVRRTRLGKSGQQIYVGDKVLVEGIDWLQRRGAVAAVEPRQSVLPRPAVANCTRVVVAVSLAQPEIDPLQLTRFLLTAERTGVAVDLVLTKADLLDRQGLGEWCERLHQWGYRPWPVSTATGAGLEPLRQHLAQPGIAVLCGPSGVGKSSLINALLPQLALRTGSVSGRLQRGRHTTRHVELFNLAPGALLADTPGFNRPDLPAQTGELALLFPEIRQRLQMGGCRFKNCLHQGDPGCAVGVDWDRHGLYRRCLDAAQGQSEAAWDRPDAGLKQRGHRVEPLLPQRLRQASRRRRRQEDGGED